MNRHPLRSAQRPVRANITRRNMIAPYGQRPRRAGSPGSDSGNHSGENAHPPQNRQDRRLIPLLTEVKSNTDQLAPGLEQDFLHFVIHARAAAKQADKDREALRVTAAKLSKLERDYEQLRNQIAAQRRTLDGERQARIHSEKELERVFRSLRKVGAYCSRTGADPRSISESSTDDIPQQDLDNFLHRICPLDPIVERDDKNSTRDSVLLSGGEETVSEEGSRYNLRERRSRSSRGRSGRRSRSVNPDRSRSRPRQKRQSSVEASEKQNVIVASTTVTFNPATGEPTRAVSTLAQERSKRRAERETENEQVRVKTIAMDFDKYGSSDDGAPSAPPATQNTSGGMVFSLGQTPSMQRTVAAMETPPSVSRIRPAFEPMKHFLVKKSVPILGRISCQVCGEQVRKLMMKCTQCHGTCHENCRSSMPVPCVSIVKSSVFPTTDLRYYVTDRTPMLPALVVHCVSEIEKRGLNELGLYRINGSNGKVEELYERYTHAVKGGGYPPLCDVDMPVLCSLLKQFFKRLDDTLILAESFAMFAGACSDLSSGECPEELKNLFCRLPRANRDTLAFMLLHLKKIGNTEAVKMPLSNLARVLGPTIVGSGNGSMPHMKQSAIILEALLNAPESFYKDALSDNSQDGLMFRMGTSTSFYGAGGLGPLGVYSTVPRHKRLAGLKESATKSRLFASPCLAD